MKKFARILFLLLVVLVVNSTKGIAAPVKGNDTDTSASLKSNIAIFKMMTAPTAPVPQGKSLKKAGSVARTSNNSHTTIPVKPVPEG